MFMASMLNAEMHVVVVRDWTARPPSPRLIVVPVLLVSRVQTMLQKPLPMQRCSVAEEDIVHSVVVMFLRGDVDRCSCERVLKNAGMHDASHL